MPTQKKIEVVEEFKEKFKSSKSIFLADFSGINVAETTKLRRSFKQANVEYRVLKNNLAKRSFKDAGIDGVEPMLTGMTAFAFSNDDAIAPVRVIKQFNNQISKEAKPLVIKGCVFEGKVFGADQAEAIASLPSREELLAKFVGLLQAPMSGLVNVLSGTGRNLLGVLEAVKSQKS
jgi:large subunit ribosomal protein L10